MTRAAAAIRDAVQAAALAGEYTLAAELADQHQGPSICLYCGEPQKKRKQVSIIDAQNGVRNRVGWVHASCARKVAKQLKVDIHE